MIGIPRFSRIVSTLDEYIWLGGRPVAFIRSKFDSTWKRQTDLTGDCQRNGEAMACGVYFVITDHLGTPAALIDSSRKIAGTLEYDPFGYPNRVMYHDQPPNVPYANNTNSSATFTFDPGTGMAAKIRYRLHMLDTEATTVVKTTCSTLTDYLQILNNSGNTLAPLTNKVGGPHNQTDLIGGWIGIPTTDATNNKAVKRYFVSDATNCAPGQCKGGTCTATPYTGFVQETWEYRRFESGANVAWTPIRFPGQYYDYETDLHENWNRVYDPLTGRYLQPEPLHSQAKQLTAPAYTYAKNSPLKNTDPTGKFIVLDVRDCSNWDTALAEARKRAGCDGSGQCDPNSSCQQKIKECQGGVGGRCNVCDVLQDDTFPIVKFDVNVECQGDPSFGCTTTSVKGGTSRGMRTVIDYSLCSDTANVGQLASTMLHEALHACRGPAFWHIGDELSECDAEHITDACK